MELAAIKCLEHVPPTAILVVALLEETGIPLIPLIENISTWQKLEFLASRKKVLQPGRVGTFYANRLLRILEIEELVPKRQIEKSTFPLLEALNGLVFLIDDDLLDEGRWHFEGDIEHGSGVRNNRGRGISMAEIERADLSRASTLDVDRNLQRCFRIFLDMGGALPNGCAEPRRRGVSQGGRLDEDQLLEVSAFAQDLDIVDDRAGEILIPQPEAGEGVVLREHHHRISSPPARGRRRKAGSGQDRLPPSGQECRRGSAPFGRSARSLRAARCT